jgi:hypothetical protein
MSDGNGVIMKIIKLSDLLSDIQSRKQKIGYADTEGTTEALRNKGGRRRPEKRALLRRVEERAKKAGLEPVVSYL